MRMIVRASVVAGVLLFLGAQTADAENGQVKYYRLSKVYNGKLQSTAGRVPASVSADSYGGEVVVKIKMTQRCTEGQVYRWSFNKDISILLPGDSFDVSGTALTNADDCYKKMTPFMSIAGGDGSIMAKSIRDQIGPSESELCGHGKRYVIGGTPRIYARANGETKEATIRVRDDAAVERIWFHVDIVATSPIRATNESIEHTVVYIYEAVYVTEGLDVTNWAGTWDTSFKKMVLRQSGDRVTGEYAHDRGQIIGTVSGTVLRGTWSEAPTYRPPRDAGEFELTMSADGMSFTGKWRYGSSAPWTGSWRGKRRP